MDQQIQPTGIMAPPDEQQHDMAATSYYPQEPNDLTGGLPINLDSLRDGPPGSKPFYPYSTLIRYAIKGSPNQKLLLEDIYYAIESRFPYFRTAPNGWKNSVRHNLSLNPCFEKVPRPLTDRGKGSYWTVNDNVDPRTGVHRIRKKKPKNSKGRHSEEGDVDYHPPGDQSFDDQSQYVPSMGDSGSNRQGAPYVYPPPFDPAFPMLNESMRYPPAPMMTPGETFVVDEHGNVNWRSHWMKELGNLQQVTEQQEKAGVDQDWYRMMFVRVRNALMAPVGPADNVVPPQPAGQQQQ